METPDLVEYGRLGGRLTQIDKLTTTRKIRARSAEKRQVAGDMTFS